MVRHLEHGVQYLPVVRPGHVDVDELEVALYEASKEDLRQVVGYGADYCQVQAKGKEAST